MRRRLIAVVMVALAASASPASAQEKEEPKAAPATIVLDTSGFWRCHYTLRPSVVRETDGQVKPVTFGAKWLNHDTTYPPANWREPDFDDSGWSRLAGVFTRVERRGVGPKSPLTALACRRGKFTVTDPTRVADLSLSLTYQGGVVVTLNGTEVVRGHLPAGAITPETLAEDYPLEAQIKPDGSPLILTDYYPAKEQLERMKLRDRSLENVKVPKGLLRKGVNVLAVEIHRAPFNPKTLGREGQGGVVIGWGTCGLNSIRLTAAVPDGLVPNVARPKGLQVWNSDVNACDFDQDYGDPNETLQAVRIVGTRGGSFSAKVVVGSDEPIRGLRAEMTRLLDAAHGGVIPASAAEVRYALPWGYEHGSGGRYPLPVGRFDALSPVAPEEVEVRVKEPRSRGEKLEDIVPRPVFGAVCPVWVTVHVPRDARPGDYRGTLVIRVSGKQVAAVPVKLEVGAFTLPEPRDFRTVADLIQSPDTLSLAFDEPLWSPAHWRHVEESLRLLGQLGNKTCYIPLIAETNLGNAESTVRWIARPDGSYAYDFSVLERYLDLVEKHQGRPLMVCLVVWDVFLEGGSYTGQEQYIPKDVKADREEHAGKGPEVTLLDAATPQAGQAGKTSKLALPLQSSAESRALWKPLIEELIKRLERRKLADVAMFGLCTDTAPTKEVVALYRELAPTVPWMNQAHGDRGKLHDVPVAYNAHVWGARFAVDPTQGRSHGWQQERLIVFFPRSSFDPFPMVTHRLTAEVCVAGEQRGFGRMGGDTWHVLKDARGQRTARVTEGRFPRSSWRNLNAISACLAPGPAGPVATARFEMMREGIQECEARIFIERALLDEKVRAKLADDVVARAQAVLDERTRDLLRGMSALSLGPHFTSNAENRHLWWERPAVLGAYWFIGSDWQTRSRKLFAAAAEIAKISGSR